MCMGVKMSYIYGAVERMIDRACLIRPYTTDNEFYRGS